MSVPVPISLSTELSRNPFDEFTSRPPKTEDDINVVVLLSFMIVVAPKLRTLNGYTESLFST